jgi:hypothetical protein
MSAVANAPNMHFLSRICADHYVATVQTERQPHNMPIDMRQLVWIGKGLYSEQFDWCSIARQSCIERD